MGKSTVTQNVCQILLACFRNIETTHLDVRTTNDICPQAVVPYRDKPRGLIGSLAKTLLLVLRFQRLYWGLSFLHRRQHGLLWSDHFSDFVADQSGFESSFRWLRHLSWALVPQPDLTFVLLSSPQIIQQRSREVDFEQTAEQIKHYELLLDGREAPTLIDATPTPDAVALTILDAVIELLAQRQKSEADDPLAHLKLVFDATIDALDFDRPLMIRTVVMTTRAQRPKRLGVMCQSSVDAMSSTTCSSLRPSTGMPTSMTINVHRRSADIQTHHWNLLKRLKTTSPPDSCRLGNTKA